MSTGWDFFRVWRGVVVGTIAIVVIAGFALGASAAPAQSSGPDAQPHPGPPPTHLGPPGPAGFGHSQSAVCASPAAGDARCLVHVLHRGEGVAPDASASPSGLAPSSIQTVYGFPTVPTAGTGETIGIVDAYDDPTVINDLVAFDAQYGLSCNGCFNKVVELDSLGNPPPTDSGWALEISLDVEWAHAIAPGAHILLVEALDSSYANLLAAEDYASAHAQYVSNSWGGSEFCSIFGCETSYDSHFTTPGVSYFAASGDSGLPATYPSASPNVISVGGTTLHFDSSGAFSSETGWASGGGGCSADETANTAQSAFGQYAQVGCAGKRATPDVALDADPNSGVSVYDSTLYNNQSGWWTVGGTSVSTPIWAARSADQGAVVNASYVYGNSINFRDITSGNNGASCLVGYDLCSGRGSWLDLTPTAPTAPQTLTAAPGNNSVSLSWQAPVSNGGSAVTKYTIYRSTTPGGEGPPPSAPLATVTAPTTTYPDTTAVNGQTYYYKVTASNTIGEGPLSNEANATPSATVPAPASPTNLKVTSTTTSLTLSWTAPSGPVSSYNIYRGTAPGAEGTTPYATHVGASPWTDPATAPNVTYYYQVTAVNTGGEGSRSNEASGDLNPIAAFTYSCSGATCSFNGSTSQDADVWTWSGGNSFSANSVSPSHTYTTTGKFTVTLKVTDNDSAETTSTSKSVSCTRATRRSSISCR
jgi:subtilase family serine protease